MKLNDINKQDFRLDEGPLDAIKKGAKSIGGNIKLASIKSAISKLDPKYHDQITQHISALSNKAGQSTVSNNPVGKTTATKPNTTSSTSGSGVASKAASAVGGAVKGAASAVGGAVKGAAARVQKAATSNPPQPAQGKIEPTLDPVKPGATGDTFEKAKGDIRKVQSGQKPIPPKAAADIEAAIAKLAKGDKENGVFAAQKIMNLAKAGVDVSKQQQAWVANAKAGERFLTQSVYFEISKMLKEYNLSWSDLGIRVHLLEGTNKLFRISFK
jgi:hypothetical protein